MRALSALGEREAIPALLKELARDESSSDIVIALVDLKATEAIPDFRKFLADDRRFAPHRVISAWALGELNAREAVPDLRAALQEPLSPEYNARTLQGEAALALGRLGAKEAVAEIVALALKAGERARADAVEALERLDADDARRRLAPALKDPDKGIRLAAAEALCWLGSREGVAILLELADTEDRARLGVLNWLRRPEACHRLRALSFPRFFPEEMIQAQWLIPGFRVDLGSASYPGPLLLRESNAARWFEAAEIVIDSDRIWSIRSYPLRYWTRWWESERKK